MLAASHAYACHERHDTPCHADATMLSIRYDTLDAAHCRFTAPRCRDGTATMHYHYYAITRWPPPPLRHAAIAALPPLRHFASAFIAAASRRRRCRCRLPYFRLR